MVSDSHRKEASLQFKAHISEMLKGVAVGFGIFLIVLFGPPSVTIAVTGNRPDPGWFFATCVTALPLALVSSLICFSVCRLLSRPSGAFAGFVIGLIVPLIWGWTVGRLVLRMQDRWAWTHTTTPLEVLISYTIVAVPNAIAGAIVGFVSRRKSWLA